jgi:hypothetical protein
MKSHAMPVFGLFLLTAVVLPGVEVAATNTVPGANRLPRLPWHLADIWWTFDGPTPRFESLDLDVTIDRDVSTNVNLYIAPCGLGELSGVRFYGGLQSNCNGWESRTNSTRVHLGRGGIFSRWGQGKLSVSQARGADDSRYEAAGYEGDFVSVRRPLVWTQGRYTWSLRACDTETVAGQDYTWVSCFVTAHETGLTRYIGSLRFEGKNLTFWDRHAAFVEVYSTAQIPRSEIPEVKVTFGYPRVNGQPPKLKSARVIHPGPGERSGSPDCATAVAEGSDVVVTVGPIFERDPQERRHALDVKEPAAR